VTLLAFHANALGSLSPSWAYRAGRAIHIQFVMIARIIYTAMVLEFPSWAYKAMAKL
jgi:hypothetical protein